VPPRLPVRPPPRRTGIRPAALLATGLFLAACTGPGARPDAKLECAFDSAALAGIARAGLAAAEEVRAPGPASELELTQRPLMVGGRPRVLVGASWGGPLNGVLMVADCGGKVLDVEHSGYVREIRVLPAEGGRARLWVVAVTGTGTGWRREDFELFALTPAGLRLAWSDVKFEGSYQAPSVGAYEYVGTLEQLGPDTLVHRVVRYPLAFTEWGDWVRREARAETRQDTLVWAGDTVVAAAP
jgi:hypothetical protein